MKTTTLRIAAAIVAVLLLTLPASARKNDGITSFCGDRYGACAGSAQAEPQRRHRVYRHREARQPVVDSSGNKAQPTLAGYAEQTENTPDVPAAAGSGLVTITVAGGHRITVSHAFAGPAAAVIAAAAARGMTFRRINCYSHARTHRSRSNHHSGNACDTYPSIPAELVREAGLRSGYDFRDGQHFDNARNVGGMERWNRVKHRGHHWVAAAVPTQEFSPRRHQHHYRHHHRYGGEAGSINAKLARWVHPTGRCQGSSEILATYYGSGRRTANGERFNPNGFTAASRTLPYGTLVHVTNPHTGLSTTVRINDRGPFTNAKIDLAMGAARAIGMRKSIYVCVS